MTTCGSEETAEGADGEARLPYGLAVDSRMVHVSAVPSGLACKCTCPGCGSRLVARKGSIRIAHFAHHTERACTAAYESMLHRLAKQVIADRLEVGLPAVVSVSGPFDEVLFPADVFRPDKVELEVRLDPIRPDIVAHKGNRELLIEIAVTHACGDEKLALLASRQQACIEIDLSGYPRTLEGEALEHVILYHAPRSWLWNRYLAEAEARHRRERQELDAAAQQRSRAWLEAGADLLRKAASGPIWQPGTEAESMRPWEHSLRTACKMIEHARFGDLVGRTYQGDACFNVAPSVWQSVILVSMLNPQPSEWPGGDWQMLERLRWLGCLRREFELPEESNRAFGRHGWLELRQHFPELRRPREVVTDYLSDLRAAGMLTHGPDGFLHLVDGALAEYRDRAHASTAPGQRVESVRRAVEVAIARAFRPRSDQRFSQPVALWAGGFDPDSWIRTHRLPEGTPEAIALKGGPAFGELLTRLRELALLGEPEVPVPAGSLLGLPIEAALESHRQHLPRPQPHVGREDNRVAGRALAETGRLRDEAEKRLADLSRDAAAELGLERSRAWLLEPQEALGGQSVTESGGWITHGQEKALRFHLQVEGEKRQTEFAKAREDRDKLEALHREATMVLGEKAEIWMRSGQQSLGGKRPEHVCLEPDGMQRCRALLETISRKGKGRR